MAQPIEVHVRTAVDGDHALTRPSLAGDDLLNCRDRQRSSWLHDRARILKDILNAGADLVGVDADHLIDQRARQAEGLLTDPTDRHTIGEGADACQGHPLTRQQRIPHGRRIRRIDADDPDPRIEVLEEGCDAGDQAAATDRHEHGIEVAAGLARDLHADGPLPGDHIRVVERVNEDEVAVTGKTERMIAGSIVIITVQQHFATEIDDRLHLDARRGHRHHDDRRDAAPTCRKRDPLGVVARRGADHTACGRARRQAGDLVVGAAELEGEHRLHVFALEQDGVAETARQPRGRLERRLDGHIVDARTQDALHVFRSGTGSHLRSIYCGPCARHSVQP